MSINSIINCMDDKPSEQVHQKKMLLNREFKDKANIKGLVSCVYYPSLRVPIGHFELEIEGNSYTLTNMINTIRDIIKELTLCPLRKNRNKPLSLMIKHAESKLGLPFFRFNISVTPNQLNKLRKGISTTNGITCSIAVALVLEKCADFKIPLPLPAICPFASAIYLTTAHKLGSQRIYQIESYGNPLKNLFKIIQGVAMEAMGILYFIEDDMEYLVLASTLYLTTDKKFGAQCIHQIKNLFKIIQGVAMEAIRGWGLAHYLFMNYTDCEMPSWMVYSFCKIE